MMVQLMKSSGRAWDRLTGMKKAVLNIKYNLLLYLLMLLSGVTLGYWLNGISFEDFKNFSVNWGNLVLTGTLIVITAYYAWQTRQSVKIMEDSSLPYISVYLENKSSRIMDIYLVIRNDGAQPAFDVKLDVLLGDIEIMDIPHKQKLSELRALKSSLPVLSPKSERKHLIIMSTPAIYQHIKDASTVIHTKFKDKKGKEYAQEFRLDYGDLPFVGEPNNGTLKEIKKSMKSIDDSIKKLVEK
ncbi:MAG TPA: hypothetical protein VD947_01900 [Patescibacteria group bacterium]|nr:hypothetical protein [Patescibacteria group bacterium]